MKQALRRKYHYIYKISRTFDDRYYIGMHSTENIEDGYFGSGKLITRSIKKHGVDKHVKEIIEYLSDRKSLATREKELVNKELLEDKRCMNLKIGGGGGGWPLSAGLKGFINEEHKAKFIAAGHPSVGSDELTNKVQKMHETIRMRRQNVAGYANSYADKLKTACENNANFSFFGRLHSDEAKKKIGLANSIAQAGEKNSSYGTCWVVKENIKPFKIKKEQLDEYISNGYSRGRKNIP